MALTPEYRDFLRELFARFGAIQVKRLFNFDGLFHDGTIFGIVADERVYLKSDAKTRKKFAENGASPFRYRGRDGSEVVTSYYELPARLYDEPDEAVEWARAAHEAAQRSPNTLRKAQRNMKTKRRRPSNQHKA